MSLRSRRRLFTRRKASPLRLLGALTLIFAGSFAATVLSFDWPESPAPGVSNAKAQGLLARIPALRLAANPSQHEHR